MLEKRARYHCLSSLININRYSTDFVSSIIKRIFDFERRIMVGCVRLNQRAKKREGKLEFRGRKLHR